jgi:small subunit ribosomal protein S15
MRKKELMKDCGQHAHDTGSVEVQIALLTEQINQLNGHFQTHPHDYASRTGLMKSVGRRRRFLNYIQSSNQELYQTLVTKLGLRK